MIKVLPVGPVTLYYTVRRFRHERIAKKAWEEVDRKLAGKGLDLGVYRHGSTPHPGRMVTALSLEPEGVEKADRIMRHGAEVDIYDDGDMSEQELRALAARRARIVMGGHEGGQTHVTFRRGEEGTRLNPDGTMDE